MNHVHDLEDEFRVSPDSLDRQLTKYVFRELRRIAKRSDFPFFRAQGREFQSKHGLVYTRLATRWIPGVGQSRTLDLGRFEIYPQYRNQGRFSHLLSTTERLARRLGLVVYVESIVNPDLIQILKKRGYTLSALDLDDWQCPNAWRQP